MIGILSKAIKIRGSAGIVSSWYPEDGAWPPYRSLRGTWVHTEGADNDNTSNRFSMHRISLTAIKKWMRKLHKSFIPSWWVVLNMYIKLRGKIICSLTPLQGFFALGLQWTAKATRGANERLITVCEVGLGAGRGAGNVSVTEAKADESPAQSRWKQRHMTQFITARHPGQYRLHVALFFMYI